MEIGKCIDEYMALRKEADATGKEAQIDERLESIVRKMFDRCLQHGQLEQAVGIALDSCHLDLLKTVVEHGRFDTNCTRETQR